jgi:hypothetical protein
MSLSSLVKEEKEKKYYCKLHSLYRNEKKEVSRENNKEKKKTSVKNRHYRLGKKNKLLIWKLLMNLGL